MQKITWRQAAAWRIHRHYLDRRSRPGSMLAVASRLCGLHAQVLSSAGLTLWARVEGFDRGYLERALWKDRTLVKTWAMRGTLHLLPAAELPLWHAVLGASRRYDRPDAWKKYVGLTMEEVDRVTNAIATALDGRVMTREALMREVARITGLSAIGGSLSESWGMILKPAAFSGRLCFGPSIGQRVQFTHPGTWLGTSPAPMDGAEAQAAVTRRFLSAYGPATYHDVGRWWTGGGVTIARKWIAALGDEACQVDLDGAPAWMLARHARELRELPPPRSVRLLPGFDQYTVGASHHAGSLLPGDLRHRVFRPQGWISPVLLVNGRMEGVWRHEMKGSAVQVAVEPFTKPAAWVRKAAGEEAERLAEYLGGDLQLNWK